MSKGKYDPPEGRLGFMAETPGGEGGACACVRRCDPGLGASTVPEVLRLWANTGDTRSQR